MLLWTVRLTWSQRKNTSSVFGRRETLAQVMLTNGMHSSMIAHAGVFTHERVQEPRALCRITNQAGYFHSALTVFECTPPIQRNNSGPTNHCTSRDALPTQ